MKVNSCICLPIMLSSDYAQPRPPYHHHTKSHSPRTPFDRINPMLCYASKSFGRFPISAFWKEQMKAKSCKQSSKLQSNK